MDLSNLDRYKESNRLEAKAAQGGLPRSIWETISAFANTNGGMIVLGAKERKEGTLEVSGLSNADKMLDDFWNAAHSSDKLYPCVLADRVVRIEGVEGAQLIVIDVPRADRHLRPVYVNGNPMTGTYRRDHKGDYRCAASEIYAMYRDAFEESIEMLPNVLHSRRMSGLLPRLGRPRAGAAGGWGPKTSLCSWSRR